MAQRCEKKTDCEDLWRRDRSHALHLRSAHVVLSALPASAGLLGDSLLGAIPSPVAQRRKKETNRDDLCRSTVTGIALFISATFAFLPIVRQMPPRAAWMVLPWPMFFSQLNQLTRQKSFLF